MRPILIATFAAFLLSGCASFYYVQNGYYESSNTSAWKYRLEDAVCTFSASDAAYGTVVVTVSTTARGEVYLHEDIDIPQGSSFMIEDSNAVVRSTRTGIVKIPIRIEVATPEPDVFNVPPYPVAPTYRFTKETVRVGKVYEGTTLKIPKAVGPKTASSFVNLTAPLKVGDADQFAILLPGMRINGQALPEFTGDFRWNDRTIHIMKKLQ